MPHKRVDAFQASGTWTCPAGITSIVVECFGAGGGGSTAVGGGGGGAYALKSLTVVPGNMYSVAVGTSAANSNGGDSTFDSTACVAQGGRSGTNGSAGGAAASSTGDTTRNGGNGSVGAGTQAGGGGAAESQAGSNASGSTGGSGGSMSGGRGGSGTTVGFLVGAGGGSTAGAQSAGARGEVRVSYDETVAAGFPYISERAFTRGTGDGTNHTINMPPSLVAGDLLLLICTSDEAPSHSVSGWTQVGATAFNALFTISQSVWYKVAVGGDTATLILGSTNTIDAACFIIKEAGVPTATSSNGNSTNADPPSHSAPISTKHLWIVAGGWDWNTAINITPPSGYGDYILVPGFNSTSPAMATCDKFLETQTENPGAFTSGTEQWVAWTISIPGLSLGHPAVRRFSMSTLRQYEIGREGVLVA